jgi:hypothetical protein
MKHFLTTKELYDILNDPVVQLNKQKLLTTNKVNFSIQRPELKTKLKELSINVSDSIPMRWIKGDTPSHIDKGESRFNRTHLIYVTDSIGNLIIDGESYPICAGDAHVFSEGVEHSTINTGNTERLMIGPMSENGFVVGGIGGVGIYFLTEQKPDLFTNQGCAYFSKTYPYQITILNYPPPTTPVSTPTYDITVSDAPVWTPPSGKIFGGWIFWNIQEPFFSNSPIVNDLSKIYMPGETYTYSNNSILVPNWINVPINVPVPRLSRLQFTNNAQVFYKSNSLSTGSGGSGVRNYRRKQRKT